MKKMKFSEKKYRQPRFNAGMAGEKLLELITGFVIADFIIMALGLLHSSEGMRGYPLPWLGKGYSDPVNFIGSLLIVSAIVAAGIIISRIAIRMTEPESKVQQTLNQYSSTYTEYTDDDAYVSENVQKKSYEQAIASDYDKVKKFISSVNSSGTSGTKSKSSRTAGRLLNGKTASSSDSDGQKKKSSLATVLTIIIAIAFFTLSNVIDSDESSYDYEDDWGDDSYYEEYDEVENSSIGLMDDLVSGDYSWLDDLTGNGAEELGALDDWENATYDKVFYDYDIGSELQTAVVRFQIDTDSSYLAALRFEGDDIFDPYSYELTGFAICEYPEEDGYYLTSYGTTHSADIPYDEDEIRTHKADMLKNAVTAGNAMIGDESILFW